MFVSDRDNERIIDTVETRNGKEIYVMDYDGANQTRVTSNRRLNITPTWSPDGRSIAYTSYSRIHPQILISNIYQGTRETLTDEKSSALMPVYSPDGSRIAFMSQRDDNSEIYVMNRDGSNVRRLTRNNSADATPTWSPTGTQIAFTSDRSGSPQIWVMDTDGLNVRRITLNESWADRATWSPAPYNEIAFSARTGPGFDIKIYDVASADHAYDHRRGRHQRKPCVFTKRPPHRVFLEPAREVSDLHHCPGRARAETVDAQRQQHVP